MIINQIDRDIELYEEHQKNPLYEEYGFSSSDFNELITLLRRKQDYLLGHFSTDNSWEWSANLHYIVVGTKTNATTLTFEIIQFQTREFICSLKASYYVRDALVIGERT